MPSDRQLEWIARNGRWRANYRPIGELVAGVAKALAQSNSPKLKAIQAAWPEIVGTELADLSFPSALKGAIITVSVATPAAKFEIDQIYRSAVLDELRTRFGRGIHEIKCTLQTLPKQ
ncbi:MAG: DUF721 domain-containing protein [Phycisphaerae bacterium]|nr:DUF721 domain-containing protein [Phycisphaerae bacterium]